MRTDTIKTPWEHLHESINSSKKVKPIIKTSYLYSILPVLFVIIALSGIGAIAELLLIIATILALRLNKNL